MERNGAMTSPTTGLLVLVFLSVFCHGSKMFVLKLSPKGAYLPSDLVQLLPECQYLGAVSCDSIKPWSCAPIALGESSRSQDWTRSTSTTVPPYGLVMDPPENL